MQFFDNRSKRIIFLGNCILNQNARFQGIAVTKGAFVEFIEVLMRKGIGIEQLPCLECMDWGGVSRNSYYRFQPLVFRSIGTIFFPIIKFCYHIWIYKFSRLCKKEAVKAVKRIEDYIKSGYEIVGVVTSNDSPTCGVTRTMHLLNSAVSYKTLGLQLKELENPDINKMRDLVPKLGIEGTGIFMRPFIKLLEKRKLNVKVIGFDPWAESLKVEAERVLKLLEI